jgi:hypothetical protein
VCLSADTGPHSPGKEWLLCQKTVLKMIKHWKEELLSMDLPFFFFLFKDRYYFYKRTKEYTDKKCSKHGSKHRKGKMNENVLCKTI